MNAPELKRIDDGFEFLGVTVTRLSCLINETKKTELIERISSLRLCSDGLSVKDAKTWEGITRYYAKLLQEEALQELDKVLFEHLKDEVATQYHAFANRNILSNLLQKFVFLSSDYRMRDKELKRELVATYLDAKREPLNSETDIQNKKIIAQRKREYQKMEAAGAEMHWPPLLSKVRLSTNFIWPSISTNTTKNPTNRLRICLRYSRTRLMRREILSRTTTRAQPTTLNS